MNEFGFFVSRTRIAYLCMEIALRPEIHTYSGGLGILAGDTVRSSSDLGLPAVFVTLMSRAGYFRQEITPEGEQREHPDEWDPAGFARPLPAMVGVDIEGRTVWVQPWLYVHAHPKGQDIPVLLLDTDLDQNAEQDRKLTHFLYGGDEVYRLKQEVILGIGGLRALDALGFEIETYHMNEGHAALLTVELLRRFRRNDAASLANGNGTDSARVRDLCIFTTHTPVDAGHDRFSYDLFRHVAGKIIPVEELKTYAGAEHPAVDGLDLTIPTGELVALVGPSGSGKTTLLNLIGCLDRPTKGSIDFDGDDITKLSQDRLAQLRLMKIGFIFQDYNLIPAFTAIENIEYVLWLQGVNSVERRKRAMEICKRFGIQNLIDRRPFQMSRGQQQRVAVARAIVHKPRIVLGDELTANLDHTTGNELMEFLKELNRKEGITFLYATHDPAMMKLAHRTISMQDGKLVSSKPSPEVHVKI